MGVSQNAMSFEDLESEAVVPTVETEITEVVKKPVTVIDETEG